MRLAKIINQAIASVSSNMAAKPLGALTASASLIGGFWRNSING
jgi:hypothetical protein